jgi:hypothetical protein
MRNRNETWPIAVRKTVVPFIRAEHSPFVEGMARQEMRAVGGLNHACSTCWTGFDCLAPIGYRGRLQEVFETRNLWVDVVERA